MSVTVRGLGVGVAVSEETFAGGPPDKPHETGLLEFGPRLWLSTSSTQAAMLFSPSEGK